MEENMASGPYRATILWNSLIRNFRTGIPLGRHRRYMKTYDDCFVASDAVEWLHQYLKKSPNFGTNVSKTQTIQLLQKLHTARVFEDVRGSKHNRGDFSDGSRLFRVTLGSPAKSIRTPIALRNNLKLANLQRSPSVKPVSKEPVKLDFDKMPSMPMMTSMPTLPDNKSTLPECHFMSKPLSPVEIEEEWKSTTLQMLQTVLGVDGLDDILDARHVNAKHIMHNCLYINKSGVVTNIDAKDQLPHWALSAMKCLAYWPNKVDDSLPNYPGFEKDVFRVVKDYFCGLPEPLMTYNMYEVITNVFGRAKKPHVTTGTCRNSTPKLKTLSSFKSVENLLLSLTRRSKISSECQDAKSERYSSANILDLSPIHPIGEDDESESQPVTRYETAFGPDNRTVTRVFYADGISTDFNHSEEASPEHEHTPVETHFNDSWQEKVPDSTAFNRRNSVRRSVHSLFNRVHSIREKKLNREKSSAHRRSSDLNVNAEKTYGCVVGVYKTSPDNDRVLKSRPEPSSPTASSAFTNRTNYHTKPPIHSQPPTFNALCPESLYPKSHEPVIDGAKRFKRKKSISSNSLHKHRSFIESSERRNESTSSTSCRPMDTVVSTPEEAIGARSLSMSDLAATPLIENELQKQCQRNTVTASEDSVFVDDPTQKIKQALQLVCLLIPPANRRRLHLLLRLMSKISNNEKLVLDETQPSRNFLVETFYRAVLTCPDEADMDELLVIQLVAFLMDHYVDILTAPNDLKVTVEQRLAKCQRTKIRYSSDDASSLQFCQQMSLAEYENQRLTSSQLALTSLLEEVLTDTSLSSKDRKKKLKMFQKMHPDIYMRRFPSQSQSETNLYQPRPRIKQPLLVRPLLKLKGLRL